VASAAAAVGEQYEAFESGRQRQITVEPGVLPYGNADFPNDNAAITLRHFVYLVKISSNLEFFSDCDH
jgi:hypothetical protein